MQRIPVALGLALSVVVGVLGGCDRPSDNAAVEQQLRDRVEQNRSFQQRIDELRARVQGDVCAPAPGSADHAAAPGSSPTSPPASTPPKVLTREQLVQRLEATTVLVLAPPMTGSGFFVAPDTVITNRHVVEKAENGEVILVGKGLGEPLLARVAAITPPVPKDTNGRDYAILKLQGGAAAGRQTLDIARSIAPLEEVVAAGYPGLLLSNDNSFQALIKGDMAAIPNLALSRGEIMAIQNRDQGFATIAHTAQISSGNSGGPLVDRCGRVVGINTFVTVNAKESSKAAYALAGADLAGYAAAHGVGLALADTKCGE